VDFAGGRRLEPERWPYRVEHYLDRNNVDLDND
jgi:hypothetical protein